MSWGCFVKRISDIKNLENSDFLDVAFIGNWPCVVRRGVYKKDQLAVYIPCDSLLSDELLSKIGLTGKLSGSRKNRVKAIKLRGQLSIGILTDPPEGSVEGDEVSEKLGVIKWEQVIPPQFAGKIRVHPKDFIKYDIENLNNYPHSFQDGELVSVTVKYHGTHISASIVDNEFGVHSRNNSLIEEPSNFYWGMARKFDVETKLRKLKEILNTDEPLYLHGEAYGASVQDLSYGLSEPALAFFDIRIGLSYICVPEFIELMGQVDLPVAKELYRGPYSLAKIQELAHIMEPISGKALHVNEGVVVKPLVEENFYQGRKFLKYINPAYLLRENGSEFQ